MKMSNNYHRVFTTQSSKAFGFLALLLSGTFLFSCEQVGVEDVIEHIKEEQKARIFKAEFEALNNSGVYGDATISYMEDGKFETHVNAHQLTPDMVHPQHIHGFGFEEKYPEQAVCPPMSAAGEDGLLSLTDGLPFYGPVLVPLDSELLPLSAEDYPVANAHGQVNYLEYTKLNNLISAIDQNTDGEQSLKNLSLDKRVIVLHGAYVKDNMIVPADTEGAVYDASLPVACGALVEVF